MSIFLILFNLIFTPTAKHYHNSNLMMQPYSMKPEKPRGYIQQAGTEHRLMMQDKHVNTESVQSITGLEAISKHYHALLVDAWGGVTRWSLLLRGSKSVPVAAITAGKTRDCAVECRAATRRHGARTAASRR